ncbi:MAG: PAS domain-containing protein [Alphaproteobacteria bacterium]|nr:PAS domain-containing protein [Alphaproteobacteria bacterium]
MLDALPHPSDDAPASRRWLLAAAVFVAALAAIGTWIALRVVDGERQRDLRSLELRMGLVADGRAAAVADWVTRQREAIRGLSENQTLQLYLTELAAAAGDRAQVADEQSQAAYVRNLMIVAAERSGFVPARGATTVNANVPRPGGAGVAVLDPGLRLLMSSHDLPAIEGRLRAVAEAARRAPAFDVVAGAGGRVLLVAAAAVAPVQGDAGASVGVVLGVRDVDAELYRLLDRPPVAERSAESVLLRRAGDALEFLSPQRDGTQPFGRRVDAAMAGLAEAQALAAPGGFAVARDIRDVDVVLVSRAVAGTDWILLHKIDRAEALGEVDGRLWRLLLVLVLGVGLLALLLVAVWRHGASRRARRAADRLGDLARRYESQSRLLRLVTDNQAAEIFIVDANGRLRFANRGLAARFSSQPGELEGKRLTAVFGPALARRYETANRAALARNAPQSFIERTDADGQLRLTRAEHVPLSGTDEPAVLVVEEDITAAIVEREKRERILQQVVDALVRVVDRRDPFAANHSARVAAVARSVAEELDLPVETIETTEIAGRLMNLGKALVPESLLTREGQLTADEHQRVREALQGGVELLGGIEFGGPVVETLRQAQERWDGAGPRRLEGEAILMPARIVAAANAFVAMVSARAHRPGVDIDAALATLMAEAARAFDRRVVAALVNVIENRGGRSRFTTPVR